MPCSNRAVTIDTRNQRNIRQLNHNIVRRDPGPSIGHEHEHEVAAGSANLEQGELPGANRSGCESRGDIGRQSASLLNSFPARVFDSRRASESLSSHSIKTFSSIYLAKVSCRCSSIESS